MEPQVTFFGVVLAPGVITAIDERPEKETTISTLHITQFALAENPKAGRHSISVVATGSKAKYVLGTLEKDRCEQFQADFMLADAVTLHNSGKSEVHLTGYKTTTDLTEPDFIQPSGSDSEDLDYDVELPSDLEADDGNLEIDNGTSSEESDEDDDEDVPQGIPLEELQKAKALGSAFSILQAANKLRRKEETASLLADLEDGDDDEEEESDLDEEMLGEEEDDEDEAEVEALVNGKKRSKDAVVESIAKKAKLDTASPAVKSPKTAGSSQKPAINNLGEGDEKWVKAIKAHIAKEGPLKLSTIGSAVKKPAGVTRKLKKLIEESGSLKIGPNEMVSVE